VIHAIVWIDHRTAHVLHVRPDAFDAAQLTAPQHLHHRHPKGPSGSKEHPDDAKRFFHEVAGSLVDAERLLVVGPSTAKLAFIRYLRDHAPLLEAKLVGVETVDHPTDPQLAAYARSYFDLDVDRN
jgi:stalled ribosome rescue protein Dom34